MNADGPILPMRATEREDGTLIYQTDRRPPRARIGLWPSAFAAAVSVTALVLAVTLFVSLLLPAVLLIFIASSISAFFRSGRSR